MNDLENAIPYSPGSGRSSSMAESHKFKAQRFSVYLYCSLGLTFLLHIVRFVLIVFIEKEVLLR